MRELYIGIDPGQKGFAAFHDVPSGSWYFVPLAADDLLRHAFDNASRQAIDVIAAIEDVHAMPGQGVSSSFNFGYNVGFVVGLLAQAGIPRTFVTPRKWQREMWEPRDRVADNAKRTSFNAARRLLPDIDFRRNERCRTWDDNMVDAALICLYAKRKGL